MPTLDEHLANTARNEVLAERLASLDAGWAVTCLFYAALHLIEAYLSQTSAANKNHREREASVRHAVELNRIATSYTRLKKESENSRYKCVEFSAASFRMLRDNMYRPLALHVRGLVTS